jgi:beta-lactamase regulating signal transducer with metallopeptidase domain
MNLLNQSAFLKALGWSLLDSLWQMALLWLVYIVLTANGKKLLSRQRHTIALLSLAGGSLWFLINLVINFYKAANGVTIVTLFVSGDDLSNTTYSWQGLIHQWLEPVLPFLSLAYLAAAAFLFIRFYVQYRHTQQLFTNGLQKAHPEWRTYLQQLAGRMGIKKKVQIWLSTLVDTPVTLGFWKPVILLPVAAINHLSIKQAEAIILHELNHIRRNDYLVNLLIACVDVVLFFNPFARLLTGIIRKERENCCDDLVLQFEYEPQSYARALLTLEQNRKASTMLTLAATGKDKFFLLNRVKRILGKEPVGNPINAKLIAYLLSSLLIGFIGWYNPGNLIVKKINLAPVTTPPAETGQQYFATNAVSVQPQPDPSPVVASKEARVEKSKNAKCCDSKDPLKKLQQLIELTTDAKLAAVAKQVQAMPEQFAGFVNNIEVKDYSIPENNAAVPAPPIPETCPYVPGNSFFYQIIEDTALPKKYVMNIKDLKAKEAMDKAMKGLQQLNWKKLELELKQQGKAIDITLIQHEIEKAMQQVDWKKINEESQQAFDEAQEAQDEAQKMQNDFVVQLGNYQKARIMQQEKIKQAQQKILLDRLQQCEELKQMEEEKKKETKTTVTVKRKRIVQI